MNNVMFSSTRQWNPGDEFILFGCQELLTRILGPFNSILYDRNPDIRPVLGDGGFRRLEPNLLSPEMQKLDAVFRLGFNSNSVKYDSDLSYLSFAVQAGSPECFCVKNDNFFSHIAVNNIPLLILGCGGVPEPLEERYISLCKKALAITVRAENIVQQLEKYDIPATYFPCPALFCAPPGSEKTIEEVQNIALVFILKQDQTVSFQGCNETTFTTLMQFYETILKIYRSQYRFTIVCHYIDELPAATIFARQYGLDVRYSFDSKDYFEIYKTFDLVISPRVHACGIASSLGIPSLAIGHDFRSSTVVGFQSEILNLSDSQEQNIQKFSNLLHHVPEKNTFLKEYKARNFHAYCSFLEEKIKQRTTPSYEKYAEQQVISTQTLKDSKILSLSLIILRIIAAIFKIQTKLQSPNVSKKK